MTLITKPNIDDNAILNDVARDCIVTTDDPTKVMLRKAFKLVTEDGIIHELSFSQLDGLINILDQSRNLSTITPLQYLCSTYDIVDLIELGKSGWIVPEYTATVKHAVKQVEFTGKLTKPSHMDKEFSFVLGDFDFVQQFSFSRVISNQHENLAEVSGTFDLTYRFTFGPAGMALTVVEV